MEIIEYDQDELPYKISWKGNIYTWKCSLRMNIDLYTTIDDKHSLIGKYSSHLKRDEKLEMLKDLIECKENVTRIYHIEPHNKHGIYMIMRYYPMTLQDYRNKRRKQNKPFTFLEIINMLRLCTNGLLKLLKCGFVHGDLKSSNIFVSSKLNHLIIGDLNDVNKINNKKIKVEGTVGTFGYKSYQRLKFMNFDEKEDVWALSIVLLELILNINDVDRDSIPSDWTSSELSRWSTSERNKIEIERKRARLIRGPKPLSASMYWMEKRNFNKKTKNTAIQQMIQTMKKNKWTELEQISIINIFKHMNEYDANDRISWQELNEMLRTIY